jgi:hypothetical protein
MSLALRKNETKKTYTQDHFGKHAVVCSWIDCLPVRGTILSPANGPIAPATREKEHQHGQSF